MTIQSPSPRIGEGRGMRYATLRMCQSVNTVDELVGIESAM